VQLLGIFGKPQAVDQKGSTEDPLLEAQAVMILETCIPVLS
jgi:hypothetical protein